MNPVGNISGFTKSATRKTVNGTVRLADWALNKNPNLYSTGAIAVSYALSHAVQAWVVSRRPDSEIPRKQRNFMVLQELLEGGLNIGMLAGAVLALKTLCENLVFKVKNAKLIPGCLFPDEFKTETIKKAIVNKLERKAISNKTLNLKYGKATIKTLEEASEKMIKYRKNAGLIANVIGTVLALTMITPALRNLIAIFINKKREKNTPIKIQTILSQSSTAQLNTVLSKHEIFKAFIN